MFASMSTSATIFRALLLVVVLAPLPLGSNRPAAWSSLAFVVGVLLLAWAIAVATGRAKAPMPFRRLALVAVPFGLTLAWGFVQSLPVLGSTLAHPLWAEVGIVSAPLSLDPAMTRTALMRLACYGGIFWLAAQLGRERVRSREALVVVAVTGVAYALYGLMMHMSGSETILWLDKWAYVGDLTSTFVNRNSYASYAGIGVLCCLALFINAMRNAWKPGQTARDKAETVMIAALPFLAGAAVIGSALMLSHSRGGNSCTALAIVVLLVAFTVGKVVSGRKALLIGGALLGGGVAVILLSGDVTFERFATLGVSDDGRTAIYAITQTAIADSPWLGFGLGAFEPAFRLYRDASLPQAFIVDMAHNTHLELAMDLGVPATLVLYTGFAAIAGTCLLGLVRRRRDQVYPAVGLSVMALLGVHGLVDFSLQMPAVAATFALLLGVAYAQSFNTVEHRR
jgi:O-antigen ligase